MHGDFLDGDNCHSTETMMKLHCLKSDNFFFQQNFSFQA